MAVLVISGCDSGPTAFVVKAVAAGVPSLAPFFEENGELGEDVDLASEPPHSGLQQGNAPGLYGGSRKPAVCDVDRLGEFLTDPRNREKTREWASVIGIDPATDGRIEEYLDTLTPVLLRHDTLVVNHDYKKGRAVAFNALLESGIAVLVDGKGMPSVKCSCGNPLRALDGNRNPEDIDVRFDNGNEKWDGYDESAVVAVRPAPRSLDRIVLVDVDDPEKGISRPVGSEGERDSTFDATERHKVPRVSGMTFGAASQKLAELGLAVAFSGDELPSADARVTGSEPGVGTELRFGEAVVLSVKADDGSPGSPSRGEPTTGEPSKGEPSKEEPTTGGPTDDEPTTGEPTTGGPTGDKPTTGGPTPDEPPTGEPT
ncbi:DUF6777 domain-containing protein, partial [Streptomyces phyllanthi]